jgi:hypothetical protein
VRTGDRRLTNGNNLLRIRSIKRTSYALLPYSAISFRATDVPKAAIVEAATRRHPSETATTRPPPLVGAVLSPPPPDVEIISMGRADGELLGDAVPAGGRGSSDMSPGAAGDGIALGPDPDPSVVLLSISMGRDDGELLGERVSAGGRGSSEGFKGDGAGLWPAHIGTSDDAATIISIVIRRMTCFDFLL